MSVCSIAVNQPTPWRKVYASNSTASAAAVNVDTAIQPISGGGIIFLRSGTEVVPVNVLFKFFGAGAATNTGTARIYGMRPQFGTTGPVWSFELICEVAITLGTGTGIAGGLASATDFYASGLVLTTGLSNGNVQMLSPQSTSANVPATILVNTRGCPYLFVELYVATATSVNAIWSAV